MRCSVSDICTSRSARTNSLFICPSLCKVRVGYCRISVRNSHSSSRCHRLLHLKTRIHGLAWPDIPLIPYNFWHVVFVHLVFTRVSPGLCVDPTVVSPLVDFLLEAAVRAPLRIGLRLFWSLRIEHEVGSLRRRGLRIQDKFLSCLDHGLLRAQFNDQVSAFFS